MDDSIKLRIPEPVRERLAQLGNAPATSDPRTNGYYDGYTDGVAEALGIDIDDMLRLEFP